MDANNFWDQLSSNIELPFEIKDVEVIESNCGSTWINMKDGSSFSISIYRCENEENNNILKNHKGNITSHK